MGLHRVAPLVPLLDPAFQEHGADVGRGRAEAGSLSYREKTLGRGWGEARR